MKDLRRLGIINMIGMTIVFIVLLSTPSIYAIEGLPIRSVNSDYVWILDVIPWLFMVLLVLCLVVFFISTKWKIQFGVTLMMILCAFAMALTPRYVHDFAIREIQVDKHILPEGLKALEELHGVKCLQYNISPKGAILMYAQEKYSEEFERDLEGYIAD